MTIGSPRSAGGLAKPESSPRRGELDEAKQLAQQAVDMGLRTAYRWDTALALEVLAEVLVQAGRHDRAVDALEEALSLFLRKGAVVDAARTRDSLAGLPVLSGYRSLTR